MLGSLCDFRQRLTDAFGRIVLVPAVGDGPLHHRTDALAHSTRSLRFCGQDGRQSRQNICCRDVRYLHFPKFRKGIDLKRRDELGRVLRILPSGLVQGMDLACGFFESQDRMSLPFRLKWVATRACDLPIFQSSGPCLGQRNQRRAAQPKLGALAPHNDALDPEAGTVALHPQVETMPVKILAWIGCRFHGPRR